MNNRLVDLVDPEIFEYIDQVYGISVRPEQFVQDDGSGAPMWTGIAALQFVEDHRIMLESEEAAFAESLADFYADPNAAGDPMESIEFGGERDQEYYEKLKAALETLKLYANTWV